LAHTEIAFAWAVDPEEVSVPEPLHLIPPAAAGVLPPALLGALGEGVELAVPLLLEPQAPTANRVVAASAADPY